MTNTEKTKPVEHASHQAARLMKVIVDKDGYPWLCDKSVNTKLDLKEQGCWQCGGTEMPFTRND